HHTAIVVFYHVCARTNVVLFLTDDHGACILSVCPSVAKNQPSKADRTPKKTSDLATDGHGYTRMRIAGFLALHREKIGTKLYGYALAKRYTNSPARGAAFFLGQNLTHGVYAPILRLEIGPDQHFAQQSRAEHHQAGQKEKAAGHHEGSVLDHDLVPQQLINRQV